MTGTLFLDVVRQRAFAALVGEGAPVLIARVLSHLKLTAWLFSGDAIQTADDGTVKIIIKDKADFSGAAVLMDTDAEVVENEDGEPSYVFEWDRATSPALIAFMDAQADHTVPVELRYEIEYTIDGKTESIGGPVWFENCALRPDDEGPPPGEDARWEWLKESIEAGDNITVTPDEDAKKLVIDFTAAAILELLQNAINGDGYIELPDGRRIAVIDAP